jgi:hypothetical protein
VLIGVISAIFLHSVEKFIIFPQKEKKQVTHLNKATYATGKVIPTCFMYLPPRSAYEVIGGFDPL